MMRPAVERSTIIVNWNAGPALRACLASVAAENAAGQEVILVDNASTDGSLTAATRDYPWVRVLPQADNLGFAGGANAGAAAATGRVLVFLNPDAVAAPGAVAMLTAVVGQRGVVVAGGGLSDLDGGWQPGAARFAPIAHLALDTTLGRWRQRRYTDPYCVDWVYGTFMAIERDRFHSLGGFDRRYFCYGEDLDLCFRVQRDGGSVWHVPGARVRHGRNVSATQRFGNRRDAEAVRGELRFYAWRQGAWALQRYRLGALAKYGCKWLWQTTRRRADDAATTAAVLATCWTFRESA
jgi:N-acetylglucosaminyl-diphospho-decaprenol L-rhamnosyltransferase